MEYYFGEHETFGMLATFNRLKKYDTTELSVVHPRDFEYIGTRCCANFYSIPNIYYSKGNSIFKIGTYQKNTPSRRTKTDEFNRDDRYIKNFRAWRGNKLISGRGKNPITNQIIKDENVGYIDANGYYCFPTENKIIEFPTVDNSLNQGFRR